MGRECAYRKSLNYRTNCSVNREMSDDKRENLTSYVSPLTIAYDTTALTSH